MTAQIINFLAEKKKREVKQKYEEDISYINEWYKFFDSGHWPGQDSVTVHFDGKGEVDPGWGL